MPGSAKRTLPALSSHTMRNGPQESVSGRANSQAKNDADSFLSSAKTMAWFREMGTDAPFGTAPPRPIKTATGVRRLGKPSTSADRLATLCTIPILLSYGAGQHRISGRNGPGRPHDFHWSI